MFSWRKSGSRDGESVNIIWRIPKTENMRCENMAFQSQTASLNIITKYAGRVARQIFIAHTVNPSFISSKAAAMAIYEYVNGEKLPRDANKAKDTAIRMA